MSPRKSRFEPQLCGSGACVWRLFLRADGGGEGGRVARRGVCRVLDAAREASRHQLPFPRCQENGELNNSIQYIF